MENRVCKKCNKSLPEGYKHKCCEACMGKKTERIKNGIIKVVSVGGPIILAFITKGKIESHKKS